MCSIREMRGRFTIIQSKMIEIMGKAMEAHKDEIIALLIHQQYEEGVDSEGQPLRSYAPRYIYEKEHLGIYRGRTDFNLTGEFHGGMNLRVEGDEYEIESTSTTADGMLKSAWLKKWNGTEIMNLTAENKLLAWEICKPTFNELISQEALAA